MKLGERLRFYRKRAALSQDEVAQQLGISRQAISQWETGKSYPDLDNLILLEKLYGFNLNELINETEKPTTVPPVNVSDLSNDSNSAQSIVKEPVIITEQSKDSRSILLLILSCVLFLIAPFGLVVGPFAFWYTKKVTHYRKIIYIVLVCAMLFNIYVIFSFIFDSVGWGITSYQ
ncbi:helix-turn-helix domain-containing protein [Lapidilactobacillus achengensis]|uniref:Helix-turn-helix domain-containing protein n=1 Tax=Lapidilactobacillus achengensis TaxID=2486000 RepID=A0ABW1UMZ2_9LACO|nr:helix-turn-helix domain-containing protein [Lapidilactobacillus achengensis]